MVFLTIVMYFVSTFRWVFCSREKYQWNFDKAKFQSQVLQGFINYPFSGKVLSNAAISLSLSGHNKHMCSDGQSKWILSTWLSCWATIIGAPGIFRYSVFHFDILSAQKHYFGSVYCQHVLQTEDLYVQ